MVIRPKSIATVVVTFWSTPSVSSTDCPASAEQFLGAQRLDLADRADHRGLADAEAAGDQNLQRHRGRLRRRPRRRSARRPWITSLGIGIGIGFGFEFGGVGLVRRLQGAQPCDHLAQDPFVGQLRGRDRAADGDAAQFQQIAEEHPDHAHGQVGSGREFRDRLGLRRGRDRGGYGAPARSPCLPWRARPDPG